MEDEKIKAVGIKSKEFCLREKKETTIENIKREGEMKIVEVKKPRQWKDFPKGKVGRKSSQNTKLFLSRKK